MGEPPRVAAETGGKEVALPVLASTLTTTVVFFPVTLLAGVSKFLFSAMALAVVVSLFASYFVAMTVVPLFSARYLRITNPEHLGAGDSGEGQTLTGEGGFAARFNAAFNSAFSRMLAGYEVLVQRVLRVPVTLLLFFLIAFAISLLLYKDLGFSYFPQTDAGQFVITFKALSGTKLTTIEGEVGNLEKSGQADRKTPGLGDHSR
jgi:multidrug efflux pump subunit AcrB